MVSSSKIISVDKNPFVCDRIKFLIHQTFLAVYENIFKAEVSDSDVNESNEMIQQKQQKNPTKSQPKKQTKAKGKKKAVETGARPQQPEGTRAETQDTDDNVSIIIL